MLKLIFWYHLFCLVILSVSLTADILVPAHTRRGWTLPRLLVKLSLGFWLANYAVFYFFFAFFPGTSAGMFDFMTVVSLLGGTGVVSGAWLYVRGLHGPLRMRDRRVALGIAVSTLLLGVAAMLLNRALLVPVFLHTYYLGATLIFALGLYYAVRSPVPRHEKITLIFMAVGFPLIWLDHLVVNFAPEQTSTAADGILVAGTLAVILSVHDLRQLRRRISGGIHPALKTGGAGLSASFRAEHSLTKRESEVASLIVAGLSGREIAEKLCISLKTVEAHTYNLYRKCGVSRRSAFIALILNAHE